MRSLFTGLICFFCLSCAFGQEAIVFTKDTEIRLNPYMMYYLDSSGQLSLDQIRQYSDQFKKGGTDDLRLGIDNTVAWLRFRVHNPYDRKEDAVIDFNDPSLLNLTLYQINHPPLYSGVGTSQDEKNIEGNRNAFILSLSPGETRDILIRADSKNYMTLKATMEDDEYFFQKVSKEKTFIGFFYGILFLIFIYTIILFLLTRFRYFLYYGIYIVVTALFNGVGDGLTPQYLYPIVTLTNGYHGFLLAVLANVVGLLFIRSYFQPRSWSKKLDYVILGTVWGIVLLTIVLMLTNPAFGFAIMRPIGFLTLGIYLTASYMGIRQNINGSRFFFAAYAVFGVFIVIFILNLFRVIPYNPFVQYSLHFGFLLSMIILSCALGVRIYYLYQDYLREQHDKQKLIQRKNEELESQVQERTAILARKENQLRSILDNTTSVIWLVNKDYILLEFNLAFERSWQAAYGKELIKGKSLLEQYNDEESKGAWIERYDQIFKGNIINISEKYEIDGTPRTYEILGVPIRNADSVEFAAIFSTDITERILYEEQLKRQNFDLRKVNQELDSFVYSASHDLKAPLSSLQGLIGLVRMETTDSSRSQYYDMMEKSIKRLDQFIRDIIDYSRNTRVDLTYKQIDLKDLIESVLEDLQYMNHAVEFKKEINIREEVPFYHDETRMRIIFRNLLSNAIRYGYSEEGEKRLVISGSVTENELLIRIKDYGPGIGEEHKENIFKMFYRAHESSDGTGLGLYIVKETIEKMNGGISLLSGETGTTFEFHIPNYSNNQTQR